MSAYNKIRRSECFVYIHIYRIRIEMNEYTFNIIQAALTNILYYNKKEQSKNKIKSTKFVTPFKKLAYIVI